VLAYFFSRHESLYLFWLFVVSPFPFGIWLGVGRAGSHLKVYVILGLLVGLLDCLMVTMFLGLPYRFLMYSYIALPPTLVFVSGGLFGDLIERKLYPDRLQAGFAERLAAMLITESSGRGLGGVKATYENRVKHLAGLITALAPILALIGSIITAIFTYLTTVKKGTP